MTRAMLCLAGATVAVLTTPAFAASPFDGTWKGNTDTAQLSSKPDSLVIRNGTYTCSTCRPPLTIKADGQFHKVTGHPYYDEAMMKVVDAHTISDAYRRGGKETGPRSFVETDTRAGKPITVFDYTFAPDGKTVMMTATDKRDGGVNKVTFTKQ